MAVTVARDHGEWHPQTLSEGGFVLLVVAREQYVIELAAVIELVNAALTPAAQRFRQRRRPP